ncbi:hypothetical protein TI39_contig395g00005 [Zymoseptoria brevis]|uniref:Uncharacterized protein n=1 Tax=Zymoseptoria brevis TaxID=1047168 RepID=A0A0F4GR83_9PEZI|nr:hypothetical protein TI39_contig395g00005 [Zymoseptoria brevis]
MASKMEHGVFFPLRVLIVDKCGDMFIVSQKSSNFSALTISSVGAWGDETGTQPGADVSIDQTTADRGEKREHNGMYGGIEEPTTNSAQLPNSRKAPRPLDISTTNQHHHTDRTNSSLPKMAAVSPPYAYILTLAPGLVADDVDYVVMKVISILEQAGVVGGRNDPRQEAEENRDEDGKLWWVFKIGYELPEAVREQVEEVDFVWGFKGQDFWKEDEMSEAGEVGEEGDEEGGEEGGEVGGEEGGEVSGEEGEE